MRWGRLLNPRFSFDSIMKTTVPGTGGFQQSKEGKDGSSRNGKERHPERREGLRGEAD